MAILSANDLHKSYGQRTILAKVSLSIEPGERLGLVGINGSGKSTLAKILAGLEEPDQGRVARGRSVRMGYLDQTPHLPEGATAMDVVLAGLGEWSRAVARYEELSAAIAGQDGSGNRGDIDELSRAQAEAAAEVDRLGGWDRRHQASSVLGHLGISDAARVVDSMSGGERRRVALARLLVAMPDLAVLDEPTNHLDIETIEWLERYLSERSTGAILLITHDRYLLDRVVTRTLELDRGSLYSYDGGWEEYLSAKAERQAHGERVEANRQNFLRRELEWLRRQPKARSTKQKARIARAESVIQTDRPGTSLTAMLGVSSVRSGNTVLDLDKLAVDIAGRRLVTDLTLSMGKGERIGIIGPNGSGKTSLIRVLLGELEPARGTVRVGQNARIAYLDQRRSGLEEDRSVYDNVADGRATIRMGTVEISVNAYLERFLFTVPAQAQKVATLSGGERARVALARILREQANLVIFDEPTNDLDVTTLAALEEALLDFGGTVLVVTHDRWFLDRIATSILAFERDPDGAPEVVHVQGNYTRYLDYRATLMAERQAQATSKSSPAASAGPARSIDRSADKPAAASPQPRKRRGLTYGEGIELAGMLERIDAAETLVAELEAELAGPSFFQKDHLEQAAFLDRLAAAKAEAEALVERWAELEARRDE